MSNTTYQTQVKLKTAISELALEYVAGQKNMTVAEYGQVYNSEAWERMLNRIMKEIIEGGRDA